MFPSLLSHNCTLTIGYRQREKTLFASIFPTIRNYIQLCDTHSISHFTNIVNISVLFLISLKMIQKEPLIRVTLIGRQWRSLLCTVTNDGEYEHELRLYS